MKITEEPLEIKEKLILHALREKKTYISSEDISRLTGLSKRSIRVIVKNLREKLSPENQITIVSKPNAGYKLLISTREAENDILSELENISYDYKHSTTLQRQVLIFSYLTMTSDYIKIEDMEELLYLTRVHISSVIKELRIFLKPFAIDIESASYKGLKIAGTESDIRCAMSKFFIMHIQDLLINEYDDDVVNRFIQIFEDARRALIRDSNSTFSRLHITAITNIAVNTAVHITRIKKNFLLYSSSDQKNKGNFPLTKHYESYWSYLNNQIDSDYVQEFISLYNFVVTHEGYELQIPSHPIINVLPEIVYRSLNLVDKVFGSSFSVNPSLKRELVILLSLYLNDSELGNYYWYNHELEVEYSPLSTEISRYFLDKVYTIASIQFDLDQLYCFSSLFKNSLVETIKLPEIPLAFSTDIPPTLERIIARDLAALYPQFPYTLVEPKNAECIISIDNWISPDKPLIVIPIQYSIVEFQKMYVQIEKNWKEFIIKLCDLKIKVTEPVHYTNATFKKKIKDFQNLTAPSKKYTFNYFDDNMAILINISPEKKSNHLHIEILSDPVQLETNQVEHIITLHGKTNILDLYILIELLNLKQIFNEQKTIGVNIKS